MNDSTASTASQATATAVNSFLLAVASGDGIPAELYAPDAVLDATVPNWRYATVGADAIATEYSRWFAAPAAFEELTRSVIDGGEVVTYLLTWVEEGVPHAAHHCHLIGVDEDGRIASDTVFCGGRWPASLLAQMAVPG
jgi:hypothetical protein